MPQCIITENILNGAKARHIDGGQDHSILVTDQDNLYTWGSGGPQLGRDTTISQNRPMLVEDPVS